MPIKPPGRTPTGFFTRLCPGPMRRAWLACLLLLTTASAWAVPEVTDAPDSAIVEAKPRPASPRPRVCLVLSGGGARGAAHIGVIKVLEQLRVPVDCIAGTSMGAIVGGAYASGMSVDEMLEAIGQITTAKLFNDAPPRADESMRTKSDDYLPLASPEFGTKDGSLTAPKGVVSGVALEAQLRRLVKVRGVRSFDNLPIPYRAVATSLGNGGMVVFEHGELTAAMRASMSVPMLIAPLNVGGQLLVDGGLVRNLPVDVARAMGADVVIAVNLGTPLLKPDEIQGLTGVAMQTLSILTEQNVRESLASLRPTDVLIQPELGDFSAADFDDLVKAVPFGVAAAEKEAATLRTLALPEAEYAALRQRQSVASAGASPVVDAIQVAGHRRVNPETIVQQMQTQVGQPLDQATVDLDMRRIFGSGDFESVRPDVQDVDGKQTLIVNVTEKSFGPDYLRLGLRLSSDLGDDANFDLYGNWRATWLNSYGAEWRNNFVLGNNVVLDTSFYQPFSPRQYAFIEPRLVYANTPLDVYFGNVLLTEYRDQGFTASVDLGINFNQYGQVRLGVFRGRHRFTLSSGPPSLPASENDDTGGLQALLRIDQLDSVSFARSGYLLSLEGQASLTAMGATSAFNRLEGEARVAHAFGRHAFQIALRGGGPVGAGELPLYALFQLGGFLNMSGYRQYQLLGPRYAYGRLSYQTRLAQVPLLEGVYGGLTYELADMPQTLPSNDQSLFQSGTAYLAADTPIGTAYFGFGYANRDNMALYLYLGKPF